MLSKYERGLLAPTLRTALKLSLLYRVPVQEIFNEEFCHARKELAKRAETIRLAQPVLF
jgi:DNA-binding XRE family transcriptional regulator